jgi:hypothetical protein
LRALQGCLVIPCAEDAASPAAKQDPPTGLANFSVSFNRQSTSRGLDFAAHAPERFSARSAKRS